MSRLELVREKIAGAGVDGLLISNLKNVGWLTGFTGSNGFVVVTKEGGLFATDGRYIKQAEDQVKGFDIEIFSTPKTDADVLKDALKRLEVKKLGFEAETATYSLYQRWTKAADGVELVPTTGLLDALTQIKLPEEVETIRRACQLTDQCFEFLLQRIQPGLREWDIQLELEFFIRKQMAELAFDPIVVSGENGALPHGRATDKVLVSGELMTLDFGAKVDGYCADLTRTVAIGEPSQELRDMYDIVLKSQLAALEVMKPGVAAGEVDRAARTVLDEKGMAKYFTHGLGHGLGRLVHDGGRLGPGATQVLEPGQVWTVEPGVYIPGLGGVRIEDDVVVTEDGIEILTHSRKDLIVL